LLTNEIEINVENALMNLKVAQEQVSEWESTLARSKDAVSVAREDMVLSKMALEQGESHWNTVVQGTEMKLNVARQSHQAASARWSAAIVQKMEADMKLREMESQYNIEKDKHEEAVRRADILRTELANVQTRISEIESELCHAQTTNSLLTNLATALGPRAIQAFVLQNAVAHLESLTQWYLNALSDGAQRLELSLQGGDRIMRRAQVAIHGEYKDRSLSSLSGGQWRRCALALNLGFAELISRRLNFRTSFCCMDEPMTHLDSLGRLDVGRLLCKMLQQPPRNSEDDDANVDADLGGGTKSTILLILQDLAAEELEESFDCMDEVRKENGCSSVYVDLESQRALPD
jgi:DNA repair exonuclease SbcCD ATPase subunit